MHNQRGLDVDLQESFIRRIFVVFREYDDVVIVVVLRVRHYSLEGVFGHQIELCKHDELSKDYVGKVREMNVEEGGVDQDLEPIDDAPYLRH